MPLLTLLGASGLSGYIGYKTGDTTSTVKNTVFYGVLAFAGGYILYKKFKK